MRVFKIIRVNINNSNNQCYFRVEEKVGLIFKTWKPFAITQDRVNEVEFSGSDYQELVQKLRDHLGTCTAWCFDSGYREYR